MERLKMIVAAEDIKEWTVQPLPLLLQIADDRS